MPGYDETFSINRQMLSAVEGLSLTVDKILKAVRGIRSETDDITDDVEGLVKRAKDLAKESKDIADNAEDTSSAAADFSKVFLSSRLLDHVKQISRNLSTSASSLQAIASLSFASTVKAMNEMVEATDKLNTTLGSGIFNSSELLEAANKLASIGWTDLSSLTKITPVLATINKSMGILTGAFQNSVMRLQIVLKNNTNTIVSRIGDVMNNFSTLMGVTASQLQDAIATLSSSYAWLGGGKGINDRSTDTMISMGLISQLGGDASEIVKVISDFSNKSLASLTQQYGKAFAVLGISISDFQKQILSGNSAQAVAELIKAVQSKGSMDPQLANYLKELLEPMGLSVDTLNYIMASTDNVDDILTKLFALAASDSTMLGEIAGYTESLSDRIANWISSSPIASGFTSALSALGIGSVADLFGSLSAITMTLTNLSKTGILKKLLSLNLGKVAGIIAIIVTALTAFMKALQSSEEGMQLMAKVKETLKSIVKVFKEVFDSIVSALVPVFQKIIKELGPIIGTILDLIKNVIAELAPVFGEILQKLVPILASIISSVLKVVSSIIQALLPVFEDIIKTIAPILTDVVGLIAEILEAIAPVLSGVMEIVGGILATIVKAVGPIFKKMWEILKPILEVAMKIVLPLLQGFFNMLETVFKAIWNGIASVCNWLADIAIGDWHPFEFLRMDTMGKPASEGSSSTAGAPEVAVIVNNDTTSSAFKKTGSAGGRTFGFGMTGSGFHVGEDIPMASGTPLRASQLGIITGSGYNSTYGNYLSMLGMDGIQRVLGHLSGTEVSKGDVVGPGSMLGTSGDTGNSLMPHLHYETRQDGRFVNPASISNNTNVREIIAAMDIMTSRIEKKLEEVSKQSQDNADWIEEFEKKNRNKGSIPY